MTATHAVTMNGRITTQLLPRRRSSVEAELSSRLALLDGRMRFALLLWRLPERVPLDLVDLDSGPTEYIQCAGGASGRFTCEVRRLDADGGPRHEVIGRRTDGEASTVRTEAIHWAKNESIVQQNEVLDRGEIRELFGSYLATGEIPASYGTRCCPGNLEASLSGGFHFQPCLNGGRPAWPRSCRSDSCRTGSA
jgi:hypothetical protein